RDQFLKPYADQARDRRPGGENEEEPPQRAGGPAEAFVDQDEEECQRTTIDVELRPTLGGSEREPEHSSTKRIESGHQGKERGEDSEDETAGETSRVPGLPRLQPESDANSHDPDTGRDGRPNGLLRSQDLHLIDHRQQPRQQPDIPEGDAN